MKNYLFTFLFFAVTIQINFSQTSGSATSSSEIFQSLKKLNTVGSVLYVAAHPDDENTRLLAYLANERNYRTAYLSITRGDGGQNLIGNEQGESLGLIRTQELLAARKKDGAEQFFTRAKDFGYSKNPEETFKFWNKDSVLADVVFAIRTFKPDVIICRFPTTGEGGHGHHTASAILALEAFEAAADPARYPEQLQYTDVWQSKRICWNTFNFGSTNTTSPDQMKLDVGVFNTMLGKSYGEIASESRTMHKSQGFGSAKQRGSITEYFKVLKGDSATLDIFEGINTQWSRFDHAKLIGEMINSCISSFQFEFPQKSIPTLVNIYKNIENLKAANGQQLVWKDLALKKVENLLLSCSGLWLEALATDYSYVPGQTITYSVQANKRNKCDVTLNSISFLQNTDTTLAYTLKQNELFSLVRKHNLDSGFAYSSPFWLIHPHRVGFYQVNEQALRNLPENKAALSVKFNIGFPELILTIERAIEYKNTDPVKGEIYRSIELLPPVSIQFTEKVFVFSEQKPKIISITLKANKPQVSGTIKLTVPDTWKITLSEGAFSLNEKGEELVLTATITPLKNSPNGKLNASALINERIYTQSIERIEHDHLPAQFILKEAQVSILNLEIKKTSNQIAYIPGAGDDVVACLKQIGYSVDILTDELIKSADLKKYSAIITGIRAYNTNEKLQVHHPILMKYVNEGGNLIVQYNTNSRVGPLQAKIGPYPFVISRNRVTDELAEVKFDNLNHSILNFPNKITSKNFEGWIQERGIYFASEFEKNYENIFTMNDPFEKESKGSLIVCKHGKGNFVYTGLSFFRELPAGVAGAYPLFVNMIALKKN